MLPRMQWNSDVHSLHLSDMFCQSLPKSIAINTFNPVSADLSISEDTLSGHADRATTEVRPPTLSQRTVMAHSHLIDGSLKGLRFRQFMSELSDTLLACRLDVVMLSSRWCVRFCLVHNIWSYRICLSAGWNMESFVSLIFIILSF
jgi:hypothetical protein